MGNQIESANYAVGVTVQPSLQTKAAQSEKDKKKLNKFKEMLRSVLPQTQQGNEADIIEKLSTLPPEEAIALLQDEVRSAGDTFTTR